MKKNSLYSWLHLLTPGDKVLIGAILFISVASFYFINKQKTEGAFVIIEVNGIEKYRLPLTVDKQIEVTGAIGKTVIRIKAGEARVIKSDCRAKICVQSGVIKRAGEMIVCAPNKVVVRISSNNEQNIDVITE